MPRTPSTGDKSESSLRRVLTRVGLRRRKRQIDGYRDSPMNSTPTKSHRAKRGDIARWFESRHRKSQIRLATMRHRLTGCWRRGSKDRSHGGFRDCPGGDRCGPCDPNLKAVTDSRAEKLIARCNGQELLKTFGCIATFWEVRDGVFPRPPRHLDLPQCEEKNVTRRIRCIVRQQRFLDRHQRQSHLEVIGDRCPDTLDAPILRQPPRQVNSAKAAPGRPSQPPLSLLELTAVIRRQPRSQFNAVLARNDLETFDFAGALDDTFGQAETDREIGKVGGCCHQDRGLLPS